MARSVPVRAALVAGAVALLVVGLGACSSAGDDQDPETRSFALEGTTLTVDAEDSALEIVASDEHAEGRIEVTRWFDGSVVAGGDPKPTWELRDGNRLVLREDCSGFISDCSSKHRVEVPRGIRVKVENGDGSVRAAGFADALSIRTADGSVRVTDATGPLDLRTGDGSVRVEDAGGPLRVHTEDGSIHADVDSREVRARTGDGSVRLELGAIPHLVETRSGDGSVSIDLPRAAYRVATETGDGSVDVSVPRDDSSGHVVSARTGDGNVTVRTVN
ncbi:DUF4097 family beta strand repeat-containing protein [Streptomyces sp. NPDC052687]|uniref:DUF4097 family beta strand repeat-containing protein n=1 Tax=Streptomyces sp. NPDC052687 TaxID=3154759 RepID=UPI00343E6678